MTRRERLERKLEKRQEWADKATVRSGARFGAADRAVAGIEPGQPILVGHHSERRHRAALERCDSNMRRGFEESKLADHHRAKASGLETALDRSIFSDDPDAVESIEARIAANEAKRERMKLINKLYRKADAAKLSELGIDYAKLHERLNAPDVFSWCRIPYVAYELSNLGGRITADRKRLEAIKARNVRTEAADLAGGIAIEGAG